MPMRAFGLASWLMQEESGGLIVGVATLPGMPSGIAVRVAQASAGVSNRYEPAFLLPAVPAVKEEGSLVLPAGMYLASRTLEVFADGRTSMLRMNHVLQRGTDFDRVSYQSL